MAHSRHFKALTRNISAMVDQSPGDMARWWHWANELYTASPSYYFT